MPTVKADWNRRHREGEVVTWVAGWRIRFYAGHSFADRPLVNCWHAYEHRGIVLRARRGIPGPGNGRRVLGLQWRRA